MSSRQHQQKLYSSGQPRPQAPIQAPITHAKPLQQAQPLPRQRQEHRQHQGTKLRYSMAASDPASPATSTPASKPSPLHGSSPNLDNQTMWKDPFNPTTTPPPAQTTSSPNTQHTSLNNTIALAPSQELTPEERIAYGLEYMRAFLASRKSGAGTNTDATITTEKPMSKRCTAEKRAGREKAV